MNVKKINDIKISVKLIVGGLVAVFIPMLIVGVISVNTASKALVRAGSDAAARISQDLAMTTELFLSEEMKFAHEMALNPIVAETADQVAQNGLEGAMESINRLDNFLKKVHNKIGSESVMSG
ncbi:MAG: hypothetical protein HUK40_14340 [Desulfobacter sp.]|nr:hypothetical protein [Desulfobacter sp.]